VYLTLKKIEINVTAKNVPATPTTVQTSNYIVPRAAAYLKFMKEVVCVNLVQCILNTD
jgi:hypothetical protein